MLLCQLLKPDKLSIFSVASQKAANSPATKLLISRVSFASGRVILQFRNLAGALLLLLSVTLCFQPLYLKKKTNLLSGNQVAHLQVSLLSNVAANIGARPNDRTRSIGPNRGKPNRSFNED